MVHLSLATLALAATALAAPRPNPINEGDMIFEAVQAGCSGQSCDLAAMARSSGAPPPARAPKGGTAEGNRCIIERLNQLKAQGRIAADDNIVIPPAKRDLETPAKRQFGGANCKPFTLIFARGTTEGGDLGSTVGPALTNGIGPRMPNQWKFTGVSRDYPADFLGNYCVGLPGGMAMMKYLEDEVAACPNTKIVASGYSQGAMAVHNGIAFAKPDVKAKVIAAVVFGDPMNGAPIKGYDSTKIQTYCARGDGVCDGAFSIGIQHLSYNLGVNSDTGKAVDFIVRLAQSSV